MSNMTAAQQQQWDADLDNWDLTQCGPFFVDPDTGQIGAICCGTDPGSVPYFRAV